MAEMHECDECGFEAKTASALAAHKRFKHPIEKAATPPAPESVPVAEPEEEFLPAGLTGEAQPKEEAKPEAAPTFAGVPAPSAFPEAPPEETRQRQSNSPVGDYLVTDKASYGPVHLMSQEKPVRFFKGVLYPYDVDEPAIVRLMAKGVLRLATVKDVKAIRSPEGPGGALTSASMAGAGIRKQ